jgi:hypothetical protein
MEMIDIIIMSHLLKKKGKETLQHTIFIFELIHIALLSIH